MSLEEQVHIDIDGFLLRVIYEDLRVEQVMSGHHRFSFLWRYTDTVMVDPSVHGKMQQDYLGTQVIFTFKSVTGIMLKSKGLINKLVTLDEQGSTEGLYVEGISHTAVLEDVVRCRTFVNQNLQDLVQGILSEGPGEFFHREVIAPTITTRFPWLIQYNETNFEFLTRLAARYGQWFYFDGMRMQFGVTKPSKIVLLNSSTLHEFRIETQLTSHKVSLGGYDYRTATNVRAALARTSEGSGDGYAKAVGQRQGGMAQHELKYGTYTSQPLDQGTIDEMAKIQTAGNDANGVFYSGISYIPLGIGQTFTIQNQKIEHHLLVIESTHISESHGNYACKFKAIPADVRAPHYTNVHAYARAEKQLGSVIKNDDPEGLGRVRVAFNWTSGLNETDWIRMKQPHGGAGKGFYFIPEKGEEVQIEFEGNNADMPYVSGTHYNGKDSSGYSTAGNDQKVIHTRSGTKIIFNDAQKSVFIEDPSGNTWLMDGAGNISVNAPKNFTVNAGENVNITAGKNVTISAGDDMDNSAGKNITQVAGNDLSQSAAGEIIENSDKRTEIVEKDFKRQADTSNEIASEVYIFSQKENMTLQSGKTVEINSAEKSKMF